jgi:long-subunit acyl-CoA synthetase (AMP-forming)
LLNHVRGQVINGELVIAHPKLLGLTQSERPAEPEFSTGDLIDLDADNFVTIRGRRKHAFITAFGRNVSPEWIEAELTAQIEIQFAAVFGEASPINGALIVPRSTSAESQVSAAVARANEQLPDYARISNWQVVSREELLQANAITANGRLRRAEIESAFARQIESLLSDTAQPIIQLQSN